MKYKVKSAFFENWFPEMAYVLGLIFADGHLEDAHYLRGKYLRISSSDIEILEKVRAVLASEHKIVKIAPKLASGCGKNKDKKYLCRTKYLLRIGDHKIYNSLVKLGVTPKKSLTLKFPTVPVKYMRDFVRGYFDGDGSVFIDDKKKRLLVVFCCGSYGYLENLSESLAKLAQVKKQRVIKGNRSFQIKYSTLEAIKLYKFMYNTEAALFLERKYQVFQRFIKSFVPMLPKIKPLCRAYVEM